MMKPGWNMGITTKLVLLLLFFSLIPLGVQIYSLFQTAEVLKEEVGVQYQAVAEGIIEKISLHLAERSADAQQSKCRRQSLGAVGEAAIRPILFKY